MTQGEVRWRWQATSVRPYLGGRGAALEVLAQALHEHGVDHVVVVLRLVVAAQVENESTR